LDDADAVNLLADDKYQEENAETLTDASKKVGASGSVV
jgi:hypothetical protein